MGKGQRFNAGDRSQYTVRQWVELLLNALGATAELVSVPSSIAPWVRAMYSPTAGSISDQTLLDTAKARYELGVSDVIDVYSAVEKLVAWYRAHPVDEANSPAFVDRFDYASEDTLADLWASTSRDLKEAVGQTLPEDVHPMAHPKEARVLSDQRGR
jgi:hypothetical protein